MTACQLNFRSNITCITNKTDITLNDTRAPYYCINEITNILCGNGSDCCQSGYEFNTDVQQCLCKYSIIFIYKIKIFCLLVFIVQPVCNAYICGANNTCQDSELSSVGYFCICNSTTVFNGTTCVRMYLFLFLIKIFQ